MKRKFLGIFIIFLVLLFSIFIFFYFSEKSSTHFSSNKVDNNDVSSSDNFNPSLYFTVQSGLYSQQLGIIQNGFTFDQNHFLEGTNTQNLQPSKEYPDNDLVWSTILRGRITNQILLSNTYSKIFTYHSSPFISVAGKKIFIVSEGQRVGDSVMGTHGFSYQVLSNGSVKRIFSFPGDFNNASINASLNLLVSVKVFNDPTDALPYQLKPYVLETFEWQHNTFVLISKKSIHPTYHKN